MLYQIMWQKYEKQPQEGDTPNGGHSADVTLFILNSLLNLLKTATSHGVKIMIGTKYLPGTWT